VGLFLVAAWNGSNYYMKVVTKAFKHAIDDIAELDRPKTN
jgi:hypothetical protein